MMDGQIETSDAKDDDQNPQVLLERTAPRIAYSKVTGYPYVTARPGAPSITNEEIRKMLEDFP
jgi:hypothetical protein